MELTYVEDAFEKLQIRWVLRNILRRKIKK